MDGHVRTPGSSRKTGGYRRLLLVTAAVAAAAACERAQTRAPADARTTSASMRPEARPAPVKTVDKDGFVDNAGRSSSETARTEMSGMRATEIGSERPTGTPGIGFPIPLEPRTREPQPPERAPAPPIGRTTTTGAPIEGVASRAAQALCDRETSCERVGPNRPWGSLASCTNALRPIASEDLAESGCSDGFEPTAVAACLSAMRLSACDKRVDRLGAFPECEPRSLCRRR